MPESGQCSPWAATYYEARIAVYVAKQDASERDPHRVERVLRMGSLDCFDACTHVFDAGCTVEAGYVEISSGVMPDVNWVLAHPR